MFNTKIRQFILNHALSREIFFYLFNKKANLRKIDKILTKDNIIIADEIADNVIVSLTSYGERIAELKYTLYSLVRQSVRPEKIIVNIAFEDEKYLNSELQIFQKYGVEFFLCKNLRSYTKLLPTLKRYPNKCIVTADDDIYYEKDWLKRLYNEHQCHPDDVCCHAVRKITYTKEVINSYQKWKLYKGNNINQSYNSNLLLGVWGVLYPPNVFYADVINENLFMKLCPFADDIWFYFMVCLNGRKIRQIHNPMKNLRCINPYREYGISAGTTLAQQNIGENKNDIQFRDILYYYGISEQQFINYVNGSNKSIY